MGTQHSDAEVIAVSGPSARGKTQSRTTVAVTAEVFRQVYDSPASLPGKEKWITSDADVREIERVLGMPPRTIGAPLWVSGDTRRCRKCKRETNWLDIVTSALGTVHGKAMIAEVILGDRKYVNIEVPHAIAGLKCHGCGTAIRDLRSFKCHNWAYAREAMLAVIQQMERTGK